MAAKPYRPRVLPRRVPRNDVTVTLYDDSGLRGYGKVINLSASGACFYSASSLAMGERVRLRFRFLGEPEPFESWGRVVWQERGYKLARNVNGLAVHGVEFLGLSEAERRRLGARLAAGGFETASMASFGDAPAGAAPIPRRPPGGAKRST